MYRGFKNRKLNAIIVDKMFENINNHLLCAAKQLVIDYQENSRQLNNDENEIRDALYYEYLENNEFREKTQFKSFKFEREITENYQENNLKPLGRVDLKVYNKDIFSNTQAYIIIECKRIDGSQKLNKEYVKNGICRFATKTPLYSSYYLRNIMFGFIVKENINEIDITEQLNVIQRKETELIIKQDLKNNNQFFYSIYKIDNQEIGLYHIFYNFSKIIL